MILQQSYKRVLKQRDIYGNTALHLAMYGDNRSVVQALLNAGADYHAKNFVLFLSLRVGRRDTRRDS